MNDAASFMHSKPLGLLWNSFNSFWIPRLYTNA